MTGVRAGRFHRGRDHKTRETGLKRLYIYMEIPQGNSLCSYLKSTKMSFFLFYKIREQKDRTDPAWGG
jgi:hypothetical protein